MADLDDLTADLAARRDAPDPEPELSARERMMRAVERLGIRACSYSVDTWAVPCDCKVGIESDTSPHERYYCGEQTGCPELRSLHLLLSDMTDAEYDAIKGRNLARLTDAFEPGADAERVAWVVFEARPGAHTWEFRQGDAVLFKAVRDWPTSREATDAAIQARAEIAAGVTTSIITPE